jgi:hypothetical protein
LKNARLFYTFLTTELRVLSSQTLIHHVRVEDPRGIPRPLEDATRPRFNPVCLRPASRRFGLVRQDAVTEVEQSRVVGRNRIPTCNPHAADPSPVFGQHSVGFPFLIPHDFDILAVPAPVAVAVMVDAHSVTYTNLNVVIVGESCWLSESPLFLRLAITQNHCFLSDRTPNKGVQPIRYRSRLTCGVRHEIIAA